MKRKLLVAVIDSGVDKADDYLKEAEIQNLYYEEREFKTCYVGKLNPHGTEVIKVILKEAPDIKILSIRTLREDNRCMLSAIINSIKYCIDEGVDIINLSLGSCVATAKRLEDLKEVCDKAVERGIAIFAADHNIAGKKSYPANFSNVLGVTALEDAGQFCRVSYEDRIVEFSDNLVYVPDLAKCTIRRGNSYLCPLIVGIFCKFIEGQEICKSSILQFMDFLVKFSKAENISKIYFDKYDIEEQHSLDNKKMLFFADDMDLNNMQIYAIYKEVNGARLCFKEIYKKSEEEIVRVIQGTDVFYIGALSNPFIHENKEFLDNLITILLKERIEIVTVFPIINTFERMRLTDEGGFIKSIYK
jgi:hypothetical protein